MTESRELRSGRTLVSERYSLSWARRVGLLRRSRSRRLATFEGSGAAAKISSVRRAGAIVGGAARLLILGWVSWSIFGWVFAAGMIILWLSDAIENEFERVSEREARRDSLELERKMKELAGRMTALPALPDCTADREDRDDQGGVPKRRLELV